MSEENKPFLPLAAGSVAPDFSLPARSGKTVSLRDFAGQKAVLVYFYPKDDTPGCTREACSLRDGWADLTSAGIEVLGISRDDAASHNAFAAKHSLPFELLTDADHAVHERYGAWGQNPNPAWGVGPLRKSFLIGKDGIVKHIFDKVETDRHAEQVLKAAGVAPAPKPAAPTVSEVADAAKAAVASAVAKVAEKVERAAAVVEKAASQKAAAAAPQAAAAKAAVEKAVKKAVRKVKKAVAKAKVKKAVAKARKAVRKAAAPKKKAAKKAVRKAVRKAAAPRKRAAKKAVRKAKRAVRRAAKAAPKRAAKNAARRKKR